eukprot:875263-Prymnesium_polylepis.1
MRTVPSGQKVPSCVMCSIAEITIGLACDARHATIWVWTVAPTALSLPFTMPSTLKPIGSSRSSPAAACASSLPP